MDFAVAVVGYPTRSASRLLTPAFIHKCSWCRFSSSGEELPTSRMWPPLSPASSRRSSSTRKRSAMETSPSGCDGRARTTKRYAGQQMYECTLLAVLFHIEMKERCHSQTSHSAYALCSFSPMSFDKWAASHAPHVPGETHCSNISHVPKSPSARFFVPRSLGVIFSFCSFLMISRNPGTTQDPGDRGVYRCPDPRVRPGDPHHRCRSDGTRSCRRELCSGV